MTETELHFGKEEAALLAALDGHGVDPTEFLYTDAGNALLFVTINEADIRYVEAWRSWAFWNGLRWEMQSDTAILPLARKVTEYAFDWAKTLPDDRKTALRKHALASQKEQRLHAMINLAKGEPSIRAQPSEFDADPWLLGCENVTVDLRNMKPHSPRRKDFITKSTKIDFDPKAKCPNWLKTLDWALQGDAETISYIQRIAGYIITGLVTEEKLFAFFGGGSNGKTTIVMTLFNALGDYAEKGRADLLLRSQGDKGAASPDVAALQGSRLIIVSETDEGCTIAEAQMKVITSNEPIRARKLHQEPFTFRPTHKFLLMTNHRPFVNDGIWRRLDIIQFNAKISLEGKNPNFREEVLDLELPGILKWMMIGCFKWQIDGLVPSASVKQAISVYRSEMDFMQQWIEEQTIADPQTSTSRSEAYASYKYWSQAENMPTLGNRRFVEELHIRGFVTSKSNGVRRFEGLKLQ